MFQEIGSNGLADIASCLLDLSLELDRHITKMIIKANSKSSFTLRMLILTQNSQSSKLEFMFLQIAPQLGHQSANVLCFLSRLTERRLETHIVIQRRFDCFAALVQQWLCRFYICATLPWFKPAKPWFNSLSWSGTFILLHGFAKTVQYTVFTFSHITIDNINPVL